MIDATFIILSSIPALMAAFGTAIGQGLIGKQALDSIHQQPSATSSILKLSVIGIAITETAAVIGAVITMIFLSDAAHLSQSAWSWYGAAGVALAVGISGFCAGIASAFPAMASCASLARQPFLQTKILNLTLITQTLIMTPNMFGMIVALIIKSKLPAIASFNEALQLFSSGMCIGLGSIGPSIGLSLFAYAACSAIGINKKAYGKILTFTFICEAIIETPIIFSLLISLMILSTNVDSASLLHGWQFFAAALCIGLSTISPGINSGRTAAAACTQIAYNIESYSGLSKITMLGLAMIDSFAIYGLLLSIMILFSV